MASKTLPSMAVFRKLLIQIIACHLLNINPLQKPMMNYCQSGPLEQLLVKFQSMQTNFLSRKCIWNAACKISLILFRVQCVKSWNCYRSDNNHHYDLLGAHSHRACRESKLRFQKVARIIKAKKPFQYKDVILFISVGNSIAEIRQ